MNMVSNKNRTHGQRVTPSLRHIYFYLTEGCNLACRHCWLSPKVDQKGSSHPILSIELFETAIREAKPLGLTGIKLTGGEPLLHPQFSKLLEIVRREDLSLTIETNGMLCTPQIAREIAKSPKRFVSVSLDGADATTHDWVRGFHGSFKKTFQAVQNLAAVNINPQIIMSIMRCNIDQVEAMVRLAENLMASSVKFNVVQPTGRGETIHNAYDQLKVPELIELGRYVDTKLEAETKLGLFFDYPLAFRPLSRISNGDGCKACSILGILGVIPSGHYSLCGIGKQKPEFVFGKVGENDLAKIWHENAILQTLRTGLPNRLDGVCSQCLMKHICLGSCVAQNYYRTGSLWAPFWFCEKAEAIGLFPTTRLGTK